MIKKFNFLADYLEISSWWTQRNMMVIDRALLPETGFVVHKEDQKVCCGWMYQTDSSIAWLGWLTTNPEFDTMGRQRALEKLILHFIDAAKSEGYAALFAETNNDSLKKRYENTGFNKGDENSSQFLRRL